MSDLKGFIIFVHKNGKEYHFVTERNTLNNKQMYSFNNWLDCYASNLRTVKSIIKDIRKKAKVIESDI